MNLSTFARPSTETIPLRHPDTGEPITWLVDGEVFTASLTLRRPTSKQGSMALAIAYKQVQDKYPEGSRDTAEYYADVTYTPAIAIIGDWCLPPLDGEVLPCNDATKARLLMTGSAFDWITNQAAQWLTAAQEASQKKVS